MLIDFPSSILHRSINFFFRSMYNFLFLFLQVTITKYSGVATPILQCTLLIYIGCYLLTLGK